MRLIRGTILLRVYRAGICRCDHITSFQGYLKEKIMNLLEIGLGHNSRGSSFPAIGGIEVFQLATWMNERIGKKHFVFC